MDKLRVTGLEVSALIGVDEWERSVRQRLLIDLEFDTDTQVIAATDDLNAALDYGVIARRVGDIVADSRCRLIESLADLIAQRLLAEFSLDRLTVVVHKPSAVPNARDTSIEITRSR
ncbi:MAG TPA: dihydroneopterin aldolase [Pseudomonadales bacterium]